MFPRFYTLMLVKFLLITIHCQWSLSLPESRGGSTTIEGGSTIKLWKETHEWVHCGLLGLFELHILSSSHLRGVSYKQTSQSAYKKKLMDPSVLHQLHVFSMLVSRVFTTATEMLVLYGLSSWPCLALGNWSQFHQFHFL